MRERSMLAVRGMRWIAAATLIIAVAPAAHAQDGLLLAGQFYSAVKDFGRPLGPGPSVRPDEVFYGGRYALIGLYVWDAHTGAIVAPIPERVVGLDAVRPRVFVVRDGAIWTSQLPLGIGRPIWTGDPSAISTCAHAYSADVLVCAVRQPAAQLLDVVAIDVAAGTSRTVGQVEGNGVGSAVWRVTPDAAKVYFATSTGTGYGVTALDLGSGARTVVPLLADRLRLDEVNERVLASSSGQITALTKDLVSLGSAAIGRYCASVAVSAHTGRLYLFERDSVGSPTAPIGGEARLHVLEATAYQPLAAAVRIDVTSIDRPPTFGCGELTLLSAPGAPRGMTAAVSGRDVTLQWVNVGAASGFVLDVGFGPGRTDFGVFLGPDSHASFANVPPGTYYLRLRGGNEFGGGRPSQEIRVVVP